MRGPARAHPPPDDEQGDREDHPGQRVEPEDGPPLRHDEDRGAEGRAEHQGPEVDGVTTLLDVTGVGVGDLVAAVVVDAEGVDLVAEVVR